MHHTLRVRPDVLSQFADLFGEKVVNGRSVHVERLIEELVSEVQGTVQALLRERAAKQSRVASGTDSYDFLDGSIAVSDADGRTASVAAIRKGMLDGFFGRNTTEAWKVGAGVPIPADTTRPGLEGTGPAIDLGMAISALNTGAASWMWDWEDAGGDYRVQLYEAWANLHAILAHEWDGREYVHPNKLARDAAGRPVAGQRRTYAIKVEAAEWPTIFHRVPGLHLRNRQITLDGAEVPAIVPALVLHAVNNFDSQRRNKSGIYYYIPKLESWQEACVVSLLLKRIEAALGVARGTLKIKVLNERGEFAVQQEVIQWVLRENLIGANVGRWDYLNSREEMFRHDPNMVIPNPTAVSMTEPSLTYYTRRNAILTTLAGAKAIGGMAAHMPNPRAPQNDARALRDIWFDKLRERLTGLFRINGTLYDTYRQSWVATVSADYVAAGREALVADLNDIPSLIKRLTAEESARLEALGLIANGEATPLELAEADISAEQMYSEDARRRLFNRPDGPTTEDGLRYALYMATEYVYQQLHGNNAAAIDDPVTGLRFMNDLATYEIFWHFLYLCVYHGVSLTGDGTYSRKGDRVTPQLFMTLLEERRQTVKDLFARLGVDYEASDAELVLQILQRQIVERDGSVVTAQRRWVKYGSRVLLSLVERSRDEQWRILDAISGDRDQLVTDVATARDPEAKKRAEGLLTAYDFVYDVFDSVDVNASDQVSAEAIAR